MAGNREDSKRKNCRVESMKAVWTIQNKGNQDTYKNIYLKIWANFSYKN